MGKKEKAHADRQSRKKRKKKRKKEAEEVTPALVEPEVAPIAWRASSSLGVGCWPWTRTAG